MSDDLSVDSRTDEDLDKLADQTEVARNSERPMTDADVKETATGNKTAAQEQYEFEHGGKTVRGTREQLIKWAQMGYDRPQVMQKFNLERQKEKEALEKTYGIYRQIDDYAKQNADWWNFVTQQWQSRGTTPTPQQAPGSAPTVQNNDPYAPKFQALEQKLSHFEQIAQSWNEQQQILKQQADDEKLDTEIKSMRDQNSHLDWDTPDENGKSLELRILEHAQSNGIPTFRAAMRDLLHDELLNRAQSQAKIAVAKGIQHKTKLGVLGESPTPQKWSPQNRKNIRQTSYEELEADIREELRQGRS